MDSVTTDEELVERWFAGCHRSSSELFDRHYAVVERFFRGCDFFERRDLVQQTFLETLRGRGRLAARTVSFRAYVLGVAHNVLRSHIRAVARAKRVVHGRIAVRDPGPGPDTYTRGRRMEDAFWKAMGQLPVDNGLALKLHYCGELTAAEIAATTGTSEETVRSRIHRGRGQLQRALKRMGTRLADETLIALRSFDDESKS